MRNGNIEDTMSSQKKRQSDTKTKERVSRPRKYKVIMFNDDYTPMEFVIQILEQIFNRSSESHTHYVDSTPPRNRCCWCIFQRNCHHKMRQKYSNRQRVWFSTDAGDRTRRVTQNDKSKFVIRQEVSIE